MSEVLFQADLDHSRFITIHQIKRSLLFVLPKNLATEAILWSTRVLVTSRSTKKIPLRYFRQIRDSIYRVLFEQRATNYVFKNDVLIFLAAVMEFLHR